MKKASAAVWIIWIVITILVAAGLVYYYQFTKIPNLQSEIDNLKNQVKNLQDQINAADEDPTADWETYTDETNNYSIKYPNDWEAKELSSGAIAFGAKDFEENDYRILIEKKTIGTGSEWSVTIDGTAKNARNVSFEDFATYWKPASDPEITEVEAEKVQGADDSEIYLVKYTASSVEQYQGFVNMGGNDYLNIGLLPKYSDEYLDTLKNMLSTFQFTE